MVEKLRNAKASVSMKFSSLKTRTTEKLETYKSSRLSKQFNKETASTDSSFTTSRSKIISPKEKEKLKAKELEETEKKDYWHLDDE